MRDDFDFITVLAICGLGAVFAVAMWVFYEALR